MGTLYYYHADFLEHDTGLGHPESVDRLVSIDKALSTPPFNGLTRIEAPLRNDIQKNIALIHQPSFIDSILNRIPQKDYHLLDNDTILSPGTGAAALLAVSAVCDAVDKVCSEAAKNAFCAVRPPGHHAESSRAMGFCIFNNVAIAAEFARTQHHLKRIAIVDFDVHHGNGIQKAFYNQPDIFYASSHEMPNYPGTGYPSETGAGNILNVPLPPCCTGSEFRSKYTKTLLPALKAFNPDLLLISAGFDAHKDDPLASILLVEDDYSWVTRELAEIADSCCNGRIISTLEGGYNLEALAKSVAAHVHVLMDS